MDAGTRLGGLDSVRGLAAVWVAIAHGAAFPLRDVLIGIGVDERLLPRGLDGLLFNSTAAVTVFFVVSGLCIHWPYVEQRSLQLVPYLVRRLVRVGFPLAIVFAFLSAVGGTVEMAGKSVLWTIYCELIYYVLYPAILFAFRRFGIVPVLAVSIVVSLGLIFSDWSELYPGRFGIFAWVVCLPYWLAGCFLAERLRVGYRLGKSEFIWLWRMVVWAVSVLALWLIFHSPVKVGYPFSMLLFAGLVIFWLQSELIRYRSRNAVQGFEWLGRFGYSIYLLHLTVIASMAELDLSGPAVLLWLLRAGGVLIVSYAFFLVVERPSHNLARSLAARISANRSASA